MSLKSRMIVPDGTVGDSSPAKTFCEVNTETKDRTKTESNIK